MSRIENDQKCKCGQAICVCAKVNVPTQEPVQEKRRFRSSLTVALIRSRGFIRFDGKAM